MTMDEARELFGYDEWANRQMFDAAEALSPDLLAAPVVSSFPSIRGTLGHIVVAEWVWLRRWLGESPTSVPPWVTEASLSDLRTRLATVEAERDQYLAGLSDVDLCRVVEYRTIAGHAHADPVAALMRHVVNHSTYHRGQAATQLRQLGRTPPNTDLITYVRPGA